MSRRVIAGWLLAFLGVVTVVATAAVTLVRSLGAGEFVWSAGQTVSAVIGFAAFVLGVVAFAGSIFAEMRN